MVNKKNTMGKFKFRKYKYTHSAFVKRHYVLCEHYSFRLH